MLGAISLSAESTSFGRGLFRYAPFGHSLYADVHPNFPRMDIPMITTNPAYSWDNYEGAYKCHFMANFGFSIPIWAGYFADSTYALAVTEHVSANLWMDFFEPKTSPIVDTDYRVGAHTYTFMHRLNRKFVKNYSVQWTPFKHESTHTIPGACRKPPKRASPKRTPRTPRAFSVPPSGPGSGDDRRTCRR